MSPITFERRDGLALITLSRPERLNAVTPAMVEELLAILDRLATDAETRVVVLTGAGRAFTAGMDVRGDGLGSAEDGGEGRVARVYRGMARSGELILRLRDIPQPVIAALHGPVAGMGMSVALACDLRVADPTATFIAPFLKLGFSAGDLGLTWLLPRLIGASRAAEIFYRARAVTATEAHDLGLLATLADEGADLDAALELAADLLKRSPFGLRHTKELLNLSLDASGLRGHLAVENRTQTMAFLTEDLAEGLTATMEKRDPRFRNR
ncbi:enoyl-CoA hydratase/isomerase family protein [Actinoallomurus iriomotensis]|uniref:Enoyl-CoA hydratase n=1 Tax=Actinoallomurus iriomotensis TaxID=478107 RepID=A0A9W6RFN2_9ACTN|nr:enoyl-CoA hydratase/isomerase family protein [Actinoallomurus iriomotensis]GLY73045.1 enoyl-CoA hydratase [Actinoallomurus iriomotensis]